MPIARLVLLVAGLVVAGAATVGAQPVPTVELRPGLIITTSVRIAAKTYRLSARPSLDSAVIIVRGNDITVDFGGAVMEGTRPESDPDLAQGVAVRVDGGRNVTIRNARIRGYKIGIMARETRGLSLLDNDLSDNWKPRLFSLVEHESLADWLSFHRNDKDEWLRFGAAAYLADVRGGEIRGNRVERGMNGVMLVRSDSLRIWNNVLSFNSGIGLGLYRSSDNTIVHNRADFNVRGYSHGFYRRGQDSSNLLLYEQSSRNVVAYNSMTHGGDGVFLWAGQSTMDTGAGGANDNLFYANDFSFAVANGIEATFSSNTFVRNRIEGSEYGIWGGYSFESRIAENELIRNRTGIAIEHGQSNEIIGNTFTGDTVGVYLWANPIEPSDWAYPKRRDTRSRGYTILDNRFTGNRVAFRVANTRDSHLARTGVSRVDSTYVLTDTVNVLVDQPTAAANLRDELDRLAPPRIPGAIDVVPDPLTRRDRSAMIVTEWGPYDWRTPLLWPIDSTHARPLRLRVVGPAGRWRLVSQRGVANLSPTSGSVGDTITLTPAADWQLALEYRGSAMGGRPYTFSYGRFEPLTRWTLSFFTWSDSTDPRTKADAFAALLRGAPMLTRDASRLDVMWYRPTIRGLPQSKFAAVATSTVTLAPGTYTLRTISDDGVRVWVDGRRVIDDWSLHESRVDYAPLTGGRHTIRVEYFQVDGWAELRLDILRGVVRSTGSPGPH
jgi:parallel beta-helix repeat protein